MKIRFAASTPIPMYGNTVERLYLVIDGKHYIVRERDGVPVLDGPYTSFEE